MGVKYAFCVFFANVLCSVPLLAQESDFDKYALHLLEQVPAGDAGALLEYQKVIEQDDPSFDVDKVACRAVELDPKKALAILDVAWGGSADNRMMNCRSLGLDRLLPEVNHWLENGPRKYAECSSGTICATIGRMTQLDLLKATFDPEKLASRVFEHRKYLKNPSRQAVVATAGFYQKKFGYTPDKARSIALEVLKRLAG